MGDEDLSPSKFSELFDDCISTLFVKSQQPKKPIMPLSTQILWTSWSYASQVQLTTGSPIVHPLLLMSAQLLPMLLNTSMIRLVADLENKTLKKIDHRLQFY